MTDFGINFVCPLTKDALRFVDRQELLKIVKRPGTVSNSVCGALISDTAGLGYPIEGDILIFVADQALPLERAKGRIVDEVGTPSNETVREWYDSFGWIKSNEGTYGDSALFSFARRNAAKTYEVLSHISLFEKLGSGRYLLDAASGAIAHPEYLSYSLFFEKRICVDFSRRALAEAKQKLGGSGIYVLADICHLPFSDNEIDSVVSLYTIQHVLADDQERAFAELYRVSKPGGKLLVVNEAQITKPRLRGWLLWPLITVSRLVCRFKEVEESSAENTKKQEHTTTSAPPDTGEIPALYGCVRPIAWWRRCSSQLGAHASVSVFRFFSHDEIQQWFRNRPKTARTLFYVEQLFGSLIAGGARYLLVEVTKPPNTREKSS